MISRFLIPMFLGVCLCCNSNKKNAPLAGTGSGKQDTIAYAHGFSITLIGKLRLLKVHNPWEGAKGIEYRYLLCSRNDVIPDSLKKLTVIYTPVKRIICLSTTHIAMISMIGEITSVVGVSGPSYVSDSLVRVMVANGKITDVGYDQALNYENIISLKPDMVLAYGIQGETASQYKKLEDMGIKVVLNAEYLEETALGKLEWIKFVAAFFEKSDLATAKFKHIAREYEQLSAKCINIKDKPRVLSGLPWKGVWYVPGGNSYAASLIKDAGGSYLWKDNTQRESLPLNFEKVIERSEAATVWINIGNANSKQAIQAEDPRLSQTRSFKLNNIYNNNMRMNPSGGNDFWESGITNPHLILKDLIKIFHPELLPDYSLVYYKKLE